MTERPKCSRCGAELPASAPGGHCLKCLLQLGLEANTVQETLFTEKSGDRIGAYKLLEQIGEGGCGVVYLAEQEQPVRRRVALKIIKLGMDTKQVIARFEAERQALALMEHPNIARVFDAGATDAGRPYFVMELVPGSKITEYCDAHRLTIRQRLELFVQVCQAVQHAHQKGVIHRDLKPSNILVMEQDGRALPKIIDFGIAKATTDQRLTDKTLFTAFEIFIGTPAYMSPEQASLGGMDVDTRSDIYSLGVLLYELLCGQPLFEAATLQRAALEEVLNTIRKTEPDRPATRVMNLPQKDAAEVAARRQTELMKLPGQLRGELDWIVMKALDKDRNRRYPTANGLAMDVDRFLNGDAVTARPQSLAYRFAKTVTKNKVAFAICGLLAVLVASSTWLYLRGQRALEYKTLENELIQSNQERYQNRSDEPSNTNFVAKRIQNTRQQIRLHIKLGSDWKNTAELRMELIQGLKFERQFDESEKIARDLIAEAQSHGLTLTNDLLLSVTEALARIKYDQSNYLEAENMGRTAFTNLTRETYGNSFDDSKFDSWFVGLLWRNGKYAEARQRHRELLDRYFGESDYAQRLSTEDLQPVEKATGYAEDNRVQLPPGQSVAGWTGFEFFDSDSNCTLKSSPGAAELFMATNLHLLPLQKRDPSYYGTRRGEYVEMGPLNNAPRLLTEVSGDFSVEVEIAGDLDPRLKNEHGQYIEDKSSQFYWAGLMLNAGDSELLTLAGATATQFWQNYPNAMMLHEIAPTVEYWRKSDSKSHLSDYIPLPSGRFPWIRLTRKEQRISAAISQDGKEWLETESLIAHFPQKIALGVFAMNRSPKPLKVEFRHFKLAASTASNLPQTKLPQTNLLDVASLLADGQATVTHPTFDIGKIGDVFDGDISTLARSAAINPMVVTLTFATTKQISGARIYFLNSHYNDWRVETADSLADLDSMSGTFRVTLDWQTDYEGGWRERSFVAPIACRVIRLKLHRLTGDDYVHLNEWQLFQ